MKTMTFEAYLASNELGADTLRQMIARADYGLGITKAPADLGRDIARLAYHAAMTQSAMTRIDEMTKVVAA